ncbi:MAG: hypothetical protein FWC84_07725 [Alphaproteobacteria bacterium]|nr:hypothetical protein [Alphaproteobacteria bacterium]
MDKVQDHRDLAGLKVLEMVMGGQDKVYAFRWILAIACPFAIQGPDQSMGGQVPHAVWKHPSDVSPKGS